MALEFEDVKEAVLKLPPKEKREILRVLIEDHGVVEPDDWEKSVDLIIKKYRPALEELAK